MIELEAARQRVLDAIPLSPTERVPLAASLHRILAEDIVAPIDLPPFDNSAMDGYAVRVADVATASADRPVGLHLRGKIPAGQTFLGELNRGDCLRIFTGSPLPTGADAVVMQEDTRIEPSRADEVVILADAKPWENIRLRGGDIRSGTNAAQKGESISSARLALLSALGLIDVSVYQRPTVGLVVTGSELREGGQPLAPGQIYESNRAMLSALTHQAGAIPQTWPLVADTLAATEGALSTALATCDIVVTAGGASVGEMDFVKTALVNLGGEVDFWKISMRPGKPFFMGKCRGKTVFGLPGNPVSAFVTFLLLVRPALRRWQGAIDTSLPAHPAILAEAVSNPGDRRHFMRVHIDHQGRVLSSGLQASHALSSLATANGLLEVGPNTKINSGETVSVLRVDWT